MEKQREKPRFIARRREQDGETQDLAEHLLDTADYAQQFAAKIGLGPFGELAGLLHDHGKATALFYEYIGKATGLIDPDDTDYPNAALQRGEVDHSSAGAQYIYRLFANASREQQQAAQVLSLIIASHHSGLIDCLRPDGSDNYTRRMTKPEEKSRTNEAGANLAASVRERIEECIGGGRLGEMMLTTERLIKEESDAADTYSFKKGLLVRFLFSCLIDADRLSTAKFEQPEWETYRNQGRFAPWVVLAERLEAHLRSLDKQGAAMPEGQRRVNELRRRISDQCLEYAKRPGGLYQLTVPTGGGKTLSSLRFALSHAKEHSLERIIYVIPYTSIIDQNADQIRKVLEGAGSDGSIVLEHHSNMTPEEETTRQKVLAENWDAPVVLTTMVQFLETLFGAGTRGARRMHQLAKAVIIFDEIQTLPVNCVHLFNLAVRFLIRVCGSTVVLCTATQPLLDRVEPPQRALLLGPEQQMVQDYAEMFQVLRRVAVEDKRKVGGWSETEIADLAVQALADTGSVLLVTNTKKAALHIYHELKDQTPAALYHLSTSMCPAHRLETLAQIRAKLDAGLPVIGVSTQLIEAGVDIDFGSVIRCLAGLNSIAQAAGRCNRHGAREKPGQVYIVNHRGEDLSRLPDIRIGSEKAERVLSEYQDNPDRFEGDVIGLRAMEQFYRYYFYERQATMCYPVGKKSVVEREDNLFQLLAVNGISLENHKQRYAQHPPYSFRQSFMTAAKEFRVIDAPTQGVIVPYGEEGKRIIADLCSVFDLSRSYRLLRTAQRYTVNLFPWTFASLAKKQIIHEVQEGEGVYYLNAQYYSDEFGLSETVVNELELLNA